MESKVNEVTSKEARSSDGYKSSLVELLQKGQAKQGYLSEEILKEIAREAGVTLNVVYGVATFYTQFKFVRPGKHNIKICLGTACHVRNAETLVDAVDRDLHIKPGETTKDYFFGLEIVRCFGSCALAPVVVVDDQVYGRMTSAKAREIIGQIK